MGNSAADDVIEWSKTLPVWKQDALRIIACSKNVSHDDKDKILKQVKASAGIQVDGYGSITTSPLVKSHISTIGTASNIAIMSLQNIQSVNQLMPNAALNFEPSSLTVISVSYTHLTLPTKA